MEASTITPVADETDAALNAQATITFPPSTVSAPANELRTPFVCKTEGCGGILGTVVHIKVRKGLTVSGLSPFRFAVKVHDVVPAPFVFAVVYAGSFTCSFCGCERTFRPSPETLRWLMEKK